MSSILDTSSLPSPAVVELLDFEAIVADIKADLLARYPEAATVLDLESEPLVKLLESFAFRELLFRARVNDAARAHLLAFATGADLDHLGALFGVSRMPGEHDERLRVRIQLRIAALSGQGTGEHYALVAMTASANVRAAYAIQPRPGYVHVVLWLHSMDTETPDAVAAAINSEGTRMLGVVVTVGTATPRPVNIHARIWRTADASPDLLQKLQQRLATGFAERAALGRSVARSWVTTLLHADGVAAVDYVGEDAPPATTTLFSDQFPTLGAVQLIDAGLM